MKTAGYAAALVLLAAVMIGADRRLLRDKKSKWVYGAFLSAGLLLSGLLLAAPGVAGPTEWVRPLFEPLGRWLAP